MNYSDFSTLKAQLADSSRKIADLTAALVYEDPSLLGRLLELTWQGKEPWSLRASRVVAICAIEHPELITNYVPSIINQLQTIKSESARRNFLQIFKEAGIRLKSRDKTTLLNSCFSFLEGKYSIGVKAYSIDIILKLSREHPEILHELKEVLAAQAEDSSPAYQGRIIKIIKKTEKTSNYRRSGNVSDR